MSFDAAEATIAELETELDAARLAADSFREERDEALALVITLRKDIERLSAEVAELKKQPQKQGKNKAKTRCLRDAALAATAIMNIPWLATSKGGDYWAAIYQELSEMANGWAGWREDNE